MQAIRFPLVALLLVLSATAALARGEVIISGKDFLRDGTPWVAEGVTLVGLVAPEGKLRPAYAKAKSLFGPDLLDQIRDYGADVIRFHVSQAGLDPQSPIHDGAYKEQVIKTVRLVRSEGFSVILCMQWQGPAGSSAEENMPSDATRRAWSEMAGAFAADKGVLFELFNEPGLKQNTGENWRIWQSGMQSLVDEVRGQGAKNVLLLDGLRGAKYLNDAPSISDPLRQTGYAVHPFLMKFNRTPKQWERNWGAFARSNPVMATAFNALSDRPAQCSPDSPERTTELFRYLRELRIGLVIWAFDLPAVRNGGDLTSFKGYSCGPGTRFGAGEAVRDYFHAH